MECVFKGADSLQSTKMTFWTVLMPFRPRPCHEILAWLIKGDQVDDVLGPEKSSGTPGIKRDPTRDFDYTTHPLHVPAFEVGTDEEAG